MYENEIDEEITLNFKKIFFALWSRKSLIFVVFIITFIVFVASTFVCAKKWKVSADLYVNKANSSNSLDINPYAIEESGGFASMLSGNAPLANEVELMKSALVIDKVIKENDLRYGKAYGFIPTKKTGELISADKFLKRKILFENKKGTHVVSISYTSKNREEAYNVVNSIITNYIALHKEINSEKSKFDKQIIEAEYAKAKEELNKKVKSASGLPAVAISGVGNLSALSAFSTSAQKAVSTMQGQYIAGEKSRVEISEDAEKVANLSSKLEWAKLVEDMSDSSKVLVIKEPRLLKDWEYASPKLFTNILLGIIFGILFSLCAVVYKEITDRKLSYSMLGDNIIYNLEKDFSELKRLLLSENGKNISVVAFNGVDENIIEELRKFNNLKYIKAELSEEFLQGIENTDGTILFATINQTDAILYKQIKETLTEHKKTILKEVLVS